MALSAKAARLGKLLPTSTALFVCDIQERFRPIISGFPAVVDTSRRMVCVSCWGNGAGQGSQCFEHTHARTHHHHARHTVLICLQRSCLQIRGANLLGLPVITTEQYPKALGNTVAELKEVLSANSPIVEKTRFSMLTQEVMETLKQTSAIKQVVMTGCWHTASLGCLQHQFLALQHAACTVSMTQRCLAPVLALLEGNFLTVVSAGPLVWHRGPRVCAADNTGPAGVGL